MALIDLARTEMTTKPPRCIIGKWYSTLDAKGQTEVRELLDALDVPSSVGARVLSKASGLKVSRIMVTRHRLNECDGCNSLGLFK